MGVSFKKIQRAEEFAIDSVDELFPSPPDYPYSDGMVNAETIPFAARTAAEFLHTERPDAVIAADRGGRILAFATHYTWGKRYPGERFPTRNNAIQLARLTAKELSPDEYKQLLVTTLGRAGVVSESGSLRPADIERTAKETKLCLMDDWVFRGRSLGIFRDVASSLGVIDSNISVITMCNRPVDGVKHVVNSAFTVWEQSAWKDDSDAVGVHFPEHAAVPAVLDSDYARSQRRDIVRNIDAYFQDFEAAFRLGGVAESDL